MFPESQGSALCFKVSSLPPHIYYSHKIVLLEGRMALSAFPAENGHSLSCGLGSLEPYL